MNTQESKILFVHFSDNWADEADFSGFRTFLDEESFKKFEDSFPEDHEFEIYFGTNESNSYVKEDFMSRFDVCEITLEDIEVLKKYLSCYCDENNMIQYGFFPYEYGY